MDREREAVILPPETLSTYSPKVSITPLIYLMVAGLWLEDARHKSLKGWGLTLLVEPLRARPVTPFGIFYMLSYQYTDPTVFPRSFKKYT